MQLLRGDVQRARKLLEKPRDALVLVRDLAAFEREAHEVDRRERKVPAADGRLFAEAVFEDARAAAHRRRLVDVALRIVRAPFFVLIERRVEIEEVREEAVRGDFARERVQVVVAVGGQVADAALLLPDLNREDRGRAVADAAVRRQQQLADDAAAFRRRVRAVVDRAEDDLIAAAGMNRVHVVHERLHRLVHALDRAVDRLLDDARLALERVERLRQIILNLDVVEAREVLALIGFEHLDFLDEAAADERREIEVERRDRLPAVHFVLRGLHGDAGENARRLDALGGARLAVAGEEAAVQNLVERVLHARQRLRRVVVLVVDVDVAFADGFLDLGREQIVVHEGLRRLARELHHHARGRVGIHVRVLARDVVRLRLDDLEEDVARLRLAGDVALLTVGDVFAGDVLALRLHQLVFHEILNRLDGHRLVALIGDALRDLLRQRNVFAEVGREHRLLNGGDDLVRVKADLAAVAFDDCEDHGMRMMTVF